MYDDEKNQKYQIYAMMLTTFILMILVVMLIVERLN